MTKEMIFAEYGIEYKNGKIFAPLFGWIAPLLVNGNSKLGKNVWTFSTLPSNKVFHVNIGTKENPQYIDILGTCVCNCQGCYAQTGFYNMPSTLKANAIKTYLVWNELDFVKRAIIAQIKAEKIDLCRIHASGDFFSVEYVNVWKDICNECGTCVFWTYTKNTQAEKAFDSIANCNVVKSIIPNIGMNYGHCDYIMTVYNVLKASGKSVHICKCGIDKNQHCNTCKGCSENEYVLFIEHSTSYKAEKDIAYPTLKEVVENQH